MKSRKKIGILISIVTIFFILINLTLPNLYHRPSHLTKDVLPLTRMENIPLLPTIIPPTADLSTKIKQLIEITAPQYLDKWFSQYAAEFGVDVNLLKKIAQCESHFGTGANNGPYGGMFQFVTSTWTATRNQMGLDPNPDLRFNGEESIKTAAFKISRGGLSAWPVCSK